MFSIPRSPIKRLALAAGVFVGLVVAVVVLYGVYQFTVASFGLQTSSLAPGDSFRNAPTSESVTARDQAAYGQSAHSAALEVSPEAPDRPNVFTSLQDYETTDYTVQARTTRLDTLCEELATLREDSRTNFRTLTVRDNNCRANFFVANEDVDFVLDTFAQYDYVTVDRTTRSITAQRTEVIKAVDVLRARLTETEEMIATTEANYEEVVALARAEQNTDALIRAMDQHLDHIDRLRERQLRLAARLDDRLREQTELEDRLGQTGFTVQFNRRTLLTDDDYAQRWAESWEQLRSHVTGTLIGLTTGLGIFLARGLMVVVYVLIAIVILRFLWKFVQYVRRW